MVRTSKTPENDSPAISIEEMSDEGEDYEVEKILSHKKVGNKFTYIVSWVGYAGETDELEEEDLNGATELLTAYKKKHNLNANSSPRALSRSARNRRKRGNLDTDDGESRRSDSVVPLDNDDLTTPRLSTRNKESGGVSETRSSSRLRSARRDERKEEQAEDAAFTRPVRTARSAPKINGSARKRSIQSDDDDADSTTAAKRSKNVSQKSTNDAASTMTDWLLDDSGSEKERKAPVKSPSPSQKRDDHVEFPSPRIGLFNNIEVAHVTALKCDRGKKTVKVVYKQPVPSPFKPSDIVDTRFVRYYAPQKLIDLYENLLTAD